MAMAGRCLGAVLAGLPAVRTPARRTAGAAREAARLTYIALRRMRSVRSDVGWECTESVSNYKESNRWDWARWLDEAMAAERESEIDEKSVTEMVMEF